MLSSTSSDLTYLLTVAKELELDLFNHFGATYSHLTTDDVTQWMQAREKRQQKKDRKRQRKMASTVCRLPN